MHDVIRLKANNKIGYYELVNRGGGRHQLPIIQDQKRTRPGEWKSVSDIMYN